MADGKQNALTGLNGLPIQRFAQEGINVFRPLTLAVTFIGLFSI